MALDNSYHKSGIVIDPRNEPLEATDPQNEEIEKAILAVHTAHRNLSPPGIHEQLQVHCPKDGLKVSQAEVNFVLASHGLCGLRLLS